MISLNTEFEVIDKINPQKITIHSRTNSGIQLKSFNKRKQKKIYIYIYMYILSLNHCILIMILVNIESLSQHLKWKVMMLRKSTVSYTANTQSQRHLHNTKKREPNKEHRCGAGRIPSEGQVRTSHNSRVLEKGKLCVPWLVRVLGLL